MYGILKLLLLIFVTFSILCSLACDEEPADDQDLPFNSENITQSFLEACGKSFRLTFPESTVVEGFCEPMGRDYFAYLTIKIKANDLEDFIGKSPFAHEELDSKVSRLISDDIGKPWWKPTSSKKFLSKQVQLPPYSTFIGILIDLDNPDELTIYLDYTGPSINFEVN